MELRQINQLSRSEIKQIVEIHLRALTDSFVNRFGLKFLSLLYKSIVGNKNNIVIVIKKRHRIVGFVVATTDSSSFVMNVIIDSFIKFPLETIVLVAGKLPIAAWAVVWQFFGKKPESRAELQFIAIDKNFRGQGLGSKLVNKLARTFRDFGVREFIVGTKSSDTLSNNFWRKMGYKYIGEYSAFGQPLNYYLAKYLKKKVSLLPRN